jgi:hypothetical protein
MLVGELGAGAGGWGWGLGAGGWGLGALCLALGSVRGAFRHPRCSKRQPSSFKVMESTRVEKTVLEALLTAMSWRVARKLSVGRVVLSRKCGFCAPSAPASQAAHPPARSGTQGVPDDRRLRRCCAARPSQRRLRGLARSLLALTTMTFSFSGSSPKVSEKILQTRGKNYA